LSSDGTLDWVQEGKPGKLPAWPVTLAETLRQTHGERAIIGKWHLGPANTEHPLNHGFTHFQGIKGAENDLNYPVWWKNWTKLGLQQYVTTYTTSVVINNLRQRNGALNQAAFVHIAYQAAHAPFALPGDAKGTNNRAKRPEMIRLLDREIGTIMDEVRSLSRPTLVFFLSDNGSHVYAENAPFRGHKRDLYEGGIHVPAIVWMPGTVPSGHVVDDVVDVKDVLPTVADIVGAPVPANLDGRSIVPLVRGGHLPERTWFWNDRYGGFAALHYPWKLHVMRGGATELYNLGSDPGEAQNIASANSDVRASLTSELADWRREVGR
jgi:arylsulfatase A-like enzyme